MNQSQRKPEDCPHRFPASADLPAASARCGLLGEITRVADPALTLVGRDACEACCKSFPPSTEEFNPVIASLLYVLTTRLLTGGANEGGDLAKARAIHARASYSLPSDEDCREAPPDRAGDTAGNPPDSLFQVIPPPSRRAGPRVRRWAVGVTTAPRQVPTLVECLTSLASAGWDRPRLFIDGTVTIPEAFADLPRTCREPRVGAWPSYYLALAELLMREPEADAYMLVQDDALFAADLAVRAYLERVLWPGSRPGIVSLFCSRAYVQPQPGWSALGEVWTWGALAFLFPREAAQRFLADLDVVRHRWSQGGEGLAKIDGCIGQWAARHDVPVWYPTPSLVQHIGDVSTLWKGERALGYRRASWFAGSSS